VTWHAVLCPIMQCEHPCLACPRSMPPSFWIGSYPLSSSQPANTDNDASLFLS
jgi:hypothetical protein